jgi:hypothetical protein
VVKWDGVDPLIITESGLIGSRKQIEDCRAKTPKGRMQLLSATGSKANDFLQNLRFRVRHRGLNCPDGLPLRIHTHFRDVL